MEPWSTGIFLPLITHCLQSQWKTKLANVTSVFQDTEVVHGLSSGPAFPVKLFHLRRNLNDCMAHLWLLNEAFFRDQNCRGPNPNYAQRARVASISVSCRCVVYLRALTRAQVAPPFLHEMPCALACTRWSERPPDTRCHGATSVPPGRCLGRTHLSPGSRRPAFKWKQETGEQCLNLNGKPNN